MVKRKSEGVERVTKKLRRPNAPPNNEDVTTFLVESNLMTKKVAKGASVAAKLRLARANGWERLVGLKDDECEILVETKSGTEITVVAGYISRLPHDIREHLNKYVVGLSTTMFWFSQVYAAALGEISLTLDEKEYDKLLKINFMSQCIAGFRQTPTPIEETFANTIHHFPMPRDAIEFRTLPSGIYDDAYNIYGFKVHATTVKTYLMKNIGTRLRDAVIIGNLVNEQMEYRDCILGKGKKRKVGNLSFHACLKANPDKLEIPFDVDEDFVKELTLDVYTKGDCNEDESSETRPCTKYLIVWAAATRFINETRVIWPVDVIGDRVRAKHPDVDEEEFNSLVEERRQPYLVPMAPDKKPGVTFQRIGHAQLMAMCKIIDATKKNKEMMYKSYESFDAPRQRGLALGRRLGLEYDKVKASRVIQTRVVAHLLRANYKYILENHRDNLPRDCDAFQAALSYQDDIDCIHIIESWFLQRWGERKVWREMFAPILPHGTPIPRHDRPTANRGWFFQSLQVDGHSIRVSYSKFREERETLKVKLKNVPVPEDVVDDIPSTVDLDNCRSDRLRAFLKGATKVTMAAVDPGSTFPLTTSKNVVDCSNPRTIPIDGLDARKAKAPQGVIKAKGKDRSIYMGRARNKMFMVDVVDPVSPSYNQEYDDYVKGSQNFRNGGSLDEIAARAAFRSTYLDLLTGPFGKTLRRQKAENFRKTQSGVRRDSAKIMAPVNGCDRVVIQFESASFKPNKAAPYPLVKLKAILKTQGSLERIPTFYQPVNHFKTSCICIACGARYTCPHEIRQCQQQDECPAYTNESNL